VSAGKPDVAALERAFADFLAAAGVPANDPELAGTPARAAEAWATEFLDGYATTPAAALGELSAAVSGVGAVTVLGIDYTGICPHHLLPYRGVAHVTYLPTDKVAGFGRIASLVDALAHRLSLQETLAAQLCEALVGVMGARGAAVVLDAEQTCLSMRGEKRPHSRAVVEASAGAAAGEALEAIRSSLRVKGEGR
jgi:GTP cyclohydrolase I